MPRSPRAALAALLGAAAPVVLAVACDAGPAPTAGEVAASASLVHAQALAASAALVCGVPPSAPSSSPRAPDVVPAAEPAASDDRPAMPNAEGGRPRLGTFDDWVRDFVASSAPETFRPPRLRTLAMASGVPTGELVYQRSGRLFRMDLPAGTERPLTDGPGSDGAPTFTRDGGHLFFSSSRDGGNHRIFRLDASGERLVAVTRRLRPGALWTAADDGARVAYVQGTQPDGVHLVDVDGGDDVVVPMEHVQYLSFSRDGRSLLAVTGEVFAPQALVSIDVATRAVKRLAVPSHEELVQPWDLGDGRLLVVASQVSYMMGRAPFFATLSERGGSFRRLGAFDVPVGYLSFEPSPDGTRVAAAWSQRQGGFGAAFHQDVAIVSLADGAVRTHGLTRMFPRPFYQAHAPTWAPDGRHLAVTLTVCARSDCEPLLRAVVLVDAERPGDVPVFLADGGAPAFRPQLAAR